MKLSYRQIMTIALAATMLPAVALMAAFYFNSGSLFFFYVVGVVPTGYLIVYCRDDDWISTPVRGRVHTLAEWLVITLFFYPLANIIFLYLLWREGNQSSDEEKTV